MRARRHGMAMAATVALGLAACGEAPPPPPSPDELAFQDTLLERLITAVPGDVIEIPPGVHRISRSLTLNADGVTIRGAGMQESVLSFAGQIQGAEGLLVNASDFRIEDLAIEDTRGDALKINEGRNIVIRRVRAEWTNGPDEKNGSYGLYPVQVQDLLLEECVAIGASDAGIYVGQSRNVIVRNNRAEYNVAGIEIENTIGADVYGNLASNNTGGILVFNMPDLPQPGHSTRVYGNRVVANNTENFAPEGTAVAGVPAGTGVLINANDRVEIFDNDIADNDTANVIVSSYFSSGFEGQRDVVAAYDPYPETISIRGNRFSGGGESPDTLALKTLKVAMFGLNGALPDILWDGYANPDKTDEAGHLLPPYAICVDNGDALLLNADLGNNSADVTTDMTAHTCTHEPLPAVRLTGEG